MQNMNEADKQNRREKKRRYDEYEETNRKEFKKWIREGGTRTLMP